MQAPQVPTVCTSSVGTPSSRYEKIQMASFVSQRRPLGEFTTKDGQPLIQYQRCCSFGSSRAQASTLRLRFNCCLSVSLRFPNRHTHHPFSPVNGMAAMATIMKPLAGAIPVANGGLLPTRTTAGNYKQGWVTSSRRGQSRSEGVRFVVRAESDESLVGQTPTSPIDPATGEPGNLATEAKKPSPLQNGGSMEESAATTPLSPIEPGKEEAVKIRKPSPLQKGGTLDGDEAAGKDPAVTTLGRKAPSESNGAGKFDDPRWRAGTWDITKFTSNGKINWDAVIDAEVGRRKWLEENPEASNNSEPVVFDTATVPWWAWVKRFHLPEAELLNGRAAMVGYGVGYLVDSATGAGLVDQQSSFLGKLLLFITVLGVLLIRKNSDVANLRTIAKESTFYDKQWQATWKDDDNSDDKENPSNL